MYDREAHQILVLLEQGHAAEARALFMEQLVTHCRDIDAAVSAGFGAASYDAARLWEVFALAYRQGWFGGMNERLGWMQFSGPHHFSHRE
jgi:hypothetical protein